MGTLALALSQGGTMVSSWLSFKAIPSGRESSNNKVQSLQHGHLIESPRDQPQCRIERFPTTIERFTTTALDHNLFDYAPHRDQKEYIKWHI